MVACRNKDTSVQKKNYHAQYNSLHKWAYKSYFTFSAIFFICLNNIKFFNFV